jgi:hypothetical protein
MAACGRQRTSEPARWKVRFLILSGSFFDRVAAGSPGRECLDRGRGLGATKMTGTIRGNSDRAGSN